VELPVVEVPSVGMPLSTKVMPTSEVASDAVRASEDDDSSALRYEGYSVASSRQAASPQSS
jgi:hypothetical protein